MHNMICRRAHSILLAIAALTVVGCNGNPSNPAQPSIAPGAAGDAPGALTSKDYVQTAKLALAKTNDQLSALASNQVKISGQGTKSTYKVQYTFNTGSATVLKLMEIKKSANYSGCSYLPEARAVLKQGSDSQSISAVSTVNVQPNTDYTLEIQQDQNCDSLEMTLDVVVWVDPAPFASPYLARTCTGQSGQQIAFFPINGAIGYTSIQADKPFVDITEFCGETFAQFPIECKSENPSLVNFEDGASCVAGNSGNQRSFELKFQAQDGTGTLTCKANGNTTFSESLSGCIDAILDLNQYKKQL